MHDAGAALAGIAADMGAGQVQMIAQEIDKEGPVLDLGRDRLAVHRQFDCRHVETSPCFLIAPIRSTGAGLCNNDFCRGSHCDAVCVSTAVPANGGIPSVSAVGLAAIPWFPLSDTRPDAVYEIGPPYLQSSHDRDKPGPGDGRFGNEAPTQIYRPLSILL